MGSRRSRLNKIVPWLRGRLGGLRGKAEWIFRFPSIPWGEPEGLLILSGGSSSDWAQCWDWGYCGGGRSDILSRGSREGDLGTGMVERVLGKAGLMKLEVGGEESLLP